MISEEIHHRSIHTLVYLLIKRSNLALRCSGTSGGETLIDRELDAMVSETRQPSKIELERRRQV
jgi:hypothetical protein